MRAIIVALLLLLPFSVYAQVYTQEDLASDINSELENYSSFDIGSWVVSNFINHKEITAWAAPIAGSESGNYLFTITIMPYSEISGCKGYIVIYSTMTNKEAQNILAFEVCEALDDNLILHIRQKIVTIQNA